MSDPVTTFQLLESSMTIAMAAASQVRNFCADPAQKSQMSHFAASLPMGLLGNELAGEVIATGSAVTRFNAGDRVYARLDKTRGGAFAEVACVDQTHVALIPDRLSWNEAAAVPPAGLTALQALRDELRIQPGSRVFISGGAGGVGTFAIQIANALGAHVTCSTSPRGEALVRSLGCDEVVDYTRQDISSCVHVFDAGFDLIGGDTLEKMFSVVKPGGKIVSVAGVPEPQMALRDLDNRRGLAVVFWLMNYKLRAKARRAQVSYRYLFMKPSGQDLAQLSELVAHNKLRIILDSIYPFDHIEHALAYLEQGRAKGKWW